MFVRPHFTQSAAGFEPQPTTCNFKRGCSLPLSSYGPHHTSNMLPMTSEGPPECSDIRTEDLLEENLENKIAFCSEKSRIEFFFVPSNRINWMSIFDVEGDKQNFNSFLLLRFKMEKIEIDDIWQRRIVTNSHLTTSHRHILSKWLPIQKQISPPKPILSSALVN